MSNDPQAQGNHVLLQLKLDYAWRWFALHAKQRVTMFSYFLVASGILANAYGLLLREKHWEAAIAVAIIGCLAGVVSVGLDARNHQLVKLGEEVLADIEREHLFQAKPRSGDYDSPIHGILSREKKRGEPFFLFKHWVLIRSLEAVCAVVFLAAAVYACSMR